MKNKYGKIIWRSQNSVQNVPGNLNQLRKKYSIKKNVIFVSVKRNMIEKFSAYDSVQRTFINNIIAA